VARRIDFKPIAPLVDKTRTDQTGASQHDDALHLPLSIAALGIM
jgi:hypothetical protein